MEWLGELWGERTFFGYTFPRFERTMNANGGEHLSLSCTHGYLAGQREAAPLLHEASKKIDILVMANFSATVREMLGGWNMRDILPVIGFPAGAHLTASAATVARNKPNAAILGYRYLADLSAVSVFYVHPRASAFDFYKTYHKIQVPCRCRRRIGFPMRRPFDSSVYIAYIYILIKTLESV